MSENEKPRNRIAELRKEKGLTLQQVADAIGVGNNTISRYETGKREPKLETWIKLANFFGVPLAYLQGINDSKDYNFFIITKIKEFEHLLDKADENSTYSSLKKANDKLGEIEIGHSLKGFAFLHSIMSELENDPEEGKIIATLSKKQMSDIFDTISSFYYLALDANRGDKIAKKYYKKIKQTYSKYLNESMQEETKSTNFTGESNDLPF